MAGQQAYGLQEGEGEALWFFNSLVTLKASSEQTGGEFCLAEFVGRSDIATPMHVQRDDPETFYVLEGELTFFLDGGERISATAGSVLHIPAGAPHAFQVDSEVARWLDLTTPEQERFFRVVGEPAQARELPPVEPPPMDKIMSVIDEFHITILGPPPGRPPN